MSRKMTEVEETIHHMLETYPQTSPYISPQGHVMITLAPGGLHILTSKDNFWQVDYSSNVIYEFVPKN